MLCWILLFDLLRSLQKHNTNRIVGQCVDFHTGKPYYYPTHADSVSYCNDTRVGTAGALLTFACMHVLIITSALVVKRNQVGDGPASLH